MIRVNQMIDCGGGQIVVREAGFGDVGSIQSLFFRVYQGKYPVDFAMDPQVLQAEMADSEHHLWLVAEDPRAENKLLGAVMFCVDQANRLGKAAGSVVDAAARNRGIGSALLKSGVKYLIDEKNLIDVIYGTTRTVNEGPSKMVADVGFYKMGLFPNAVQVESPEHHNLDVFLTKEALASRRRKPYLFGPFFEIYSIVRKQLKLERPYIVTERAPLKLSAQKIPFKINSDEKDVVLKFRLFQEQKRLSNSFFPFHMPKWILESEDGGTEVFIWYGGMGKQALIVGYRTDHVNVHDILDSAAFALQSVGAAYVELLVDAYDYMLQQEAYTAKYIPSAYFPAMRLAEDGLRDDYFVLSRTFRILDFTNAVVTAENYPFLQAYLKCYNDLYIKPRRSYSNTDEKTRMRSEIVDKNEISEIGL